MSKPGVNNTPMKQDMNPFKKDNRSTSNSNVKDEKRSSDSFTSPSSRGHSHNQSRGNSHQNRNQHDDRQYDKSGRDSRDSKRDDKDSKSSSDQTGSNADKKFTGRCRLFVGNLTPDVTEDDFRKMFEQYGEVSEVYVNTSRGFGFIRLDYRQSAEAAKAGLDGLQRKGRILRVRFATHGAALKVKNLHPFVSNELLEQSFSQFGELERCIVIVDDRGKPTGEGIVEFVRKPGANSALRRIKEGVFLMGVDPKPVAVEPLEQKDEEDGMPEKFLTKTDQYKKEREKEPRFAPPGTFEYEFGMRWKQLEELEKQRIEQVKKDTEEARLKLEDEMQNALYEYQAEQIRQDLIRQQEELRRLEELRNQDRMRRQQELEMRRQQDDRERAQQEERRRADMMMSLRQQEIARGRPLDGPGMRGRDDMLMADRYGDRMGDRLPDRMPDRPGDRMPERMGDRMGPGQSGFMWDDKQRNEAGMRGEGGRGRDMRGSGAPPLQPPPVPPTAMGAAERGGPAAATAAQNAKSSPKPLMQGSGFGGLGGPQGGGPGPNNPQASADAGNPMLNRSQQDEDSSETPQAESLPETAMALSLTGSQPHFSEDYASSGVTDQLPEESVDTSNSSSVTQMKRTPPRSSISDIDEADQLWETDTDYRLTKGTLELEGQQTSVEVTPSLTCSSHTTSDDSIQVMSDTEIGPQDVDYRIKPLNNPSRLSTTPQLTTPESPLVMGGRCRSEERPSSSTFHTCEENYFSHRLTDCTRAKSVESYSAGSNNTTNSRFGDKTLNFTSTGGSGHMLNSFIVKESTDTAHMENDYGIDKANEHSTSACSQGSQDSGIKTANESYESLTNVSGDDKECGRPPIQRYLSSDNPVNGSEDSYQSTGTKSCPHVAKMYMSSDTVPSPASTALNSQSKQSSSHIQTSEIMACYKSRPLSEQCNIVSGSQCLRKLVEESNYSTTNTLPKSSIPYEDNAPIKSKYTQSMEDYKATGEGGYEHPAADSEGGYEHPAADSEHGNESYYQQSQEEDGTEFSYESTGSAKHVSSYKQHAGDDVEDMDAETLEEEDGARVTVSPSIYQSYEEDMMAAHYHTAALASMVGSTPVVEQYNSVDQSAGWVSENGGGQKILPANSPQVPNGGSFSSSSTYTSTQNTLTVAATQSSREQAKTSTSSTTSSSLSSSQPQCSAASEEGDHEGALCTGDQNFKSAAARQSALVPFMKSGQSRTFISGVNPSVYAGPAMVQGMSGPSVMTSSSVHIAQHPGGATIMRQQSMSAGLNGGVAQATVMQQQAVRNGVQATAMVQQRMLTSGGQTMLVQQRTMTTGLGAVAQQTVVQQRMAAPGNIAQAAVLQANAMRQRTMVSQQAGMIPHRAVRLVQTRVVGNPLMRAQALRGPAVIQRVNSGSASTMLGTNLVRGGVNQGSVMQQLVRQRYLGGPVMPGRGIQMMAGRPIRVKMTYPRETLPMESNT